MKAETIEQRIARHEGLRLTPYRCTAGKLTIGVGRNLEDRGISNTEALYLLKNDIDHYTGQVLANLPWASSLDQTRFEVLVEMAFNLGIAGLLGFKQTLAAIKAGHYDQAAIQMLDSRWAKQVGKRADELAAMMRQGG